MEPDEPLPSSMELRDQTYRFLHLAKTVLDPQVKRGLHSSAFALSQLAECLAKIEDQR